MLRNIKRKIYKKIRFKTWYRKVSYYQRQKKSIHGIILKYKEPAKEELEDKKYMRRLRRDMIWCLFRYGSYFSEYFLFGYEGKGKAYRDSFITEGIRMSYFARLNQKKNADMFENKYRTYKKFPNMFKREMFRVKKNEPVTKDNLQKFQVFTDHHPEYVVKPVYAACGKGVRKESLSMYDTIEEAFSCYSKESVVLEEVIKQGEALSRMHAGSVNTLRIPTVLLKNEKGEPEVRLFHPSIRMGRGDSFVDNFSAGGVSALIDPETGVIYTDGADKQGHRFSSHPDSGVPFKGFQIPEWEKAVTLVKEAAMKTPDNHYCGWDLAYSDKYGWCMVEANCTAQMGAMQMVTKTGRKQELEALMKQM